MTIPTHIYKAAASPLGSWRESLNGNCWSLTQVFWIPSACWETIWCCWLHCCSSSTCCLSWSHSIWLAEPPWVHGGEANETEQVLRLLFTSGAYAGACWVLGPELTWGCPAVIVFVMRCLLDLLKVLGSVTCVTVLQRVKRTKNSPISSNKQTWDSLNIQQGRKLFMLAPHVLFERSLIAFEHNLVSSVVFSFWVNFYPL